MYSTEDTIVAVSSPTCDKRVIVRLTGPRTIEILNLISTGADLARPGITKTAVFITDEIKLEAIIYFFIHPHSYTGDDLAEIHIWSNPAVTEALIQKLYALGLRSCRPGEFTARAYLNGKIDLSQAEAVNEVITASNNIQLAAAEKLLAGRLGQAAENISGGIIESLSQLEARLDFGTEDIEPAGQASIIISLEKILKQLQELLRRPVNLESTLDMPSVAIAGAPNAGKSTLVNKLLGKKRSIVSDIRKTTRDVLTGQFTIDGKTCVLFDCAGLTTEAQTILDKLAQQAAVQAIQNATIIVFCVDMAKPDWTEDLAVWELIEPEQLVPAATKTDLIEENQITGQIEQLRELFNFDFLAISSHTGAGLDKLIALIGRKLSTPAASQDKYGIALTARHRQAVSETIDEIKQAIIEIKAGNDELAATTLRNAHKSLCDIEQSRLAGVDEKLLDRIFAGFCIGK